VATRAGEDGPVCGRAGPDAIRYMSVHSRKQPHSQEHNGTTTARSITARPAHTRRQRLFSLVVAGARFELAYAEPTVLQTDYPK
jgi:hypothetical protein